MKFSNNILEIMNEVCKGFDKFEDKKFYVDNRKLIKYLQDYEIDIPTNIYEKYKNEFGNGVLQYMEILSEENMENFAGDNSYNHNGNIYRDIDFMTCETKDGKYLVAIQTHIGGDVRGNYTDSFLLEFDFDTQFYEVIDDFCRDECGFILYYDNKEFYVTPYVFSEDLDVQNASYDEDISCCWGVDENYLKFQLDLCYLYEKTDKEIAQYIIKNKNNITVDDFIDKLKRYTMKTYESTRLEKIKEIIKNISKTLDKKID